MVEKIVLTGGPCSGKTTGIAHVVARLASCGVRPYIVPETATISYLSTGRPDPADFWRYQSHLIRLQIDVEDHFERIAEMNAKRDGKRPILVCDRGILDCKAFCPPDMWGLACEEAGVNESQILAARYSGVVHLVTSAESAPWAYTLANNAARTESAEEAVESDRRLRTAWMGHPNGLKVVRGDADFEKKIEEAANAVAGIAGLPTGGGARKKYKVAAGAIKEILNMGIETAKVVISEYYIGENRLQLLETAGGKRGTLSVRAEAWTTEKIISFGDFTSMVCGRKPDIQFERHSYFIGNNHIELDVFKQPKVGFCIIDTLGDLPLLHVDAAPFEHHGWYFDALGLCGVERFKSGRNLSAFKH